MPSQGSAPNVVTNTLPSFEHLSVIQVALTPSAVNTVTAPEQTFTVTGLSVGDALQAPDQILSISKAADQAGLAIVGARVSAANTLAIKFVNPTGGNITPTAGETYTIVVWRPRATAQANATIV